MQSTSDFERYLAESKIDYYIKKFEKNPYQRAFGRNKIQGDPDIAFDYDSFRKMGPALADPSNPPCFVGLWRAFLFSIYVNGHRWLPEEKIRSNIFVNHFATDSIPEFSVVRKDMSPTVDASFLHIIRDPVENIASLYNHWDTFYKHDYFVEMAFARWEIGLYSALRNKLLYPHGCDIVWYTSNKDEIRESLSASSIDLVRNMVNDCDVWEPTVFGQKLFGQSYKEKAGGSVSRGYQVENIFSVSQLEYLRREIDRVKEVLGVVKLKEVASEHYRPTHKLEPYLKMEPDVFNSLVKPFGETFQFISSQHVNSERYMVERLRSATIYDLLKVAVKVCIRC